MARRWVFVVDARGEPVAQEAPPFQPFTSVGKIITVKGQRYRVTAVEGDLENGNAMITVTLPDTR